MGAIRWLCAQLLRRRVAPWIIYKEWRVFTDVTYGLMQSRSFYSYGPLMAGRTCPNTRLSWCKVKVSCSVSSVEIGFELRPAADRWHHAHRLRYTDTLPVLVLSRYRREILLSILLVAFIRVTRGYPWCAFPGHVSRAVKEIIAIFIT